jgi:hypothetical protein
MKLPSFQGRAVCAVLLALAAFLGWGASPADAAGTVLIRQANGQTNVYHDVVIKVIHNALYMTTSDGKGTLVINRAACSYQGQIMVCFATNAALVQAGKTSALDLKHGTIYVNSTDDSQSLPLSTTKVPAHSILLSFSTDRGTYVSLSGRIDKVVK